MITRLIASTVCGGCKHIDAPCTTLVQAVISAYEQGELKQYDVVRYICGRCGEAWTATLPTQ